MRRPAHRRASRTSSAPGSTSGSRCRSPTSCPTTAISRRGAVNTNDAHVTGVEVDFAGRRHRHRRPGLGQPVRPGRRDLGHQPLPWPRRCRRQAVRNVYAGHPAGQATTTTACDFVTHGVPPGLLRPTARPARPLRPVPTRPRSRPAPAPARRPRSSAGPRPAPAAAF
ncbi:MAG: hypothetical protein MZV64_14720 [Ignavibacteriales bacterium]|nr:hypothetical protein [Ignavibacteriales bacterium]